MADEKKIKGAQALAQMSMLSAKAGKEPSENLICYIEEKIKVLF